jgi:hypothetical protein
MTNSTPSDVVIAIIVSNNTDACKPPKVTIPYNSTRQLEPQEFYKSELISVEALTKIDCSGVINTKCVNCAILSLFALEHPKNQMTTFQKTLGDHDAETRRRLYAPRCSVARTKQLPEGCHHHRAEKA